MLGCVQSKSKSPQVVLVSIFIISQMGILVFKYLDVHRATLDEHLPEDFNSLKADESFPYSFLLSPHHDIFFLKFQKYLYIIFQNSRLKNLKRYDQLKPK